MWLQEPRVTVDDTHHLECLEAEHGFAHHLLCLARLFLLLNVWYVIILPA
jgi:hypothetical protein